MVCSNINFFRPEVFLFGAIRFDSPSSTLSRLHYVDRPSCMYTTTKGFFTTQSMAHHKAPMGRPQKCAANRACALTSIWLPLGALCVLKEPDWEGAWRWSIMRWGTRTCRHVRYESFIVTQKHEKVPNVVSHVGFVFSCATALRSTPFVSL